MRASDQRKYREGHPLQAKMRNLLKTYLDRPNPTYCGWCASLRAKIGKSVSPLSKRIRRDVWLEADPLNAHTPT